VAGENKQPIVELKAILDELVNTEIQVHMLDLEALEVRHRREELMAKIQNLRAQILMEGVPPQPATEQKQEYRAPSSASEFPPDSR
jgi:hypothetical protein